MIDFCQKDNDGNNLLNHVAVYGDVNMIRKVISYMVDRRLELDQRNLSGYSALLLAIKNDKYLNAYELIKDGLSSASLQDYETASNALEWLLARIKVNKDSILASSTAVENPTNGRSLKAFLSDGIESKLSFQSNKTTSTNYSDYRKRSNHSSCSNNSKLGSIAPISYKTWYNSNNQYYLGNNQCDHVNNPNYSTEHHKSRFVPLILTPRKVSFHLKFNPVDQNNKNSNNNTNLTLTKSVESFNSNEIREFNKLNNDDDSKSINEQSTLKDIVQKLYQKIFQVMSQQAKIKSNNNNSQKSVSIVLPEKNITEQNGNNNPTLNSKTSKSPKLSKRSLSSKSKNSNSNNENNEPAPSPVVHFKDSIRDLYKIDRYRIDTNIFNLGMCLFVFIFI
jgi:hypothetical protein